jgi:dTDP-4-dehydrorhamnose reductase
VRKFKIKILIIGAGGMLGSALLKYFSAMPNVEVRGTVRSQPKNMHFLDKFRHQLEGGVDVFDLQEIRVLLSSYEPEIVINCVGIVKQLQEAENPLISIPVNSVLPHQLSAICADINARLIHFSTDCVFSGLKGMYKESDFADANDLYGRSKYLGEVVSQPHVLTLRTSIIGHELYGAHSLVNWFLSQSEKVQGYTKAIFSGLPTIEIAKIIDKFILGNPKLSGLYHLSGNPISKYDLLCLINKQYHKHLEIQADDRITINRSLNSDLFRAAVGYRPKDWTVLISDMYLFQ